MSIPKKKQHILEIIESAVIRIEKIHTIEEIINDFGIELFNLREELRSKGVLQ